MAYTQSAPFVEKEWLTPEEISSGWHPQEARSDRRMDMRPNKPSIHSFHAKADQVASDQPSIGRRILRTLTRFFIAVLIGVGATLAGQSYGDAAREMVAARVPTLAWLLSVSTTKSSSAAEIPPDLMQQLAPLASNLDGVRRGLEQLASKQEQMAQNVAALQAAEEDIRQRMLSASASPQQAAPAPQAKAPQPRAHPQSSSMVRPPPPSGPVSISR